MNLKRVYHPFSKWEEICYGMWAEVSDRGGMLMRAVEFTGNHKIYGEYMMRVIVEWPFSCENALTDSQLNQKAWVGHAACALALKCPEDITREAWGHLTNEQRILANKEAEQAIRVWRHNYTKDNPLYNNMGKQMLF